MKLPFYMKYNKQKNTIDIHIFWVLLIWLKSKIFCRKSKEILNENSSNNNNI